MMKYDNDLAEFVGIMLGDGCISYPKQPRIKISLNSITDFFYIGYTHNLLENIFKTNVRIKHRKYENTSDLFIFKKRIVEYIINQVKLIPSPKWNRARIPSWVFENNLEKYVLRGYFDTDGCVVIANNNGIRYPRLEMKICPSPMQNQFISILKRFKFNFGVYNIGKGKVRVQMNGKKELEKWNKYIGFSNKKHQDKSDQFV